MKDTPSSSSPIPHGVGAVVAAIDELLGLNRSAEDLLKQQQNNGALSTEEVETIKRYEQGLQKLLDLISPAGLQVRQKDLIVNDLHARTLYTYNWPNYTYPNWLSQIVNLGATIDVAQFVYPGSNKAIMKMLRKKVAELRSSIRMLEQRGIVRDPQLEAALQDAEELRDLLARGQEKLFQFGMYLTIYAEDEDRLKKMQTEVESILGGKLILTKPAMFQMEHGWISTLPCALDELEINRNMNTSPLATSFPFSSSDLTDDHGILYGINRNNDSLVIFDRFDLSNANSNIFATSGAGKSFAAKLEILRYLMIGTDVLVVDPENEYTDLCKAVGGSFIPLSIQSPFRINPFDLPKAVRGEEAAVGETLRASVINLHGLLRLMLGPITPSEDGVLDRAILDTYALSGITLQTPDPSSMEPPTLGQLVDVLMTTEGGENMARILQKYTEGSFAGLFDQHTNMELENRMIVFQIRDLEEQLRPIAMYIVLNFIWNRIRSQFKRRLLVIDEAWNLMQHEDSARFLYGIVKRARKYYLGVTTITQDVDDFVESPFGKPIITNSSMQLLLKQSPTTVDNLQKLFYLTDGEKYVLLNSDVGQGIIFAGYKHVAVQIIASPEESTLITTKPQEVAARRQPDTPAAETAPEEATGEGEVATNSRRKESTIVDDAILSSRMVAPCTSRSRRPMTLVCMYNTTVRLLLINGKPGTGKSSVSRKLFGLLPEPSAWIDTDDLMHMRPFNREHAFENALQRGLLLVEDFRHKGSMNVILTGCVHARSLWKQLQEATPKDMIIYIHLSAATDICDTRKRVQGYSEKTHPTMFQIIHNDTTDLSPDDIKPAAWIACDTSLITIEEAANQIMKLL